MRRGFKAWSERTSVEYRRALGIPLAVALDPYRLAELLGVRVTTAERIPTLTKESLHQLTVEDRESWSAVTLCLGDRRLVILNSGHSPVRQTSSLVHELAHVILNHSSDSTRLSEEGLLFRACYDKEKEDEADWLAGCLLVPRDGLMEAYRKTQSNARLAGWFGVSEQMITWRLRKTGVPRQLDRFRAARSTSVVVERSSTSRSRRAV